MTVAVLLAAGLSRRLGREKPLLELDGETLIARHARQLSAIGVRDLVVVCHAGNEAALRARSPAAGRNSSASGARA